MCAHMFAASQIEYGLYIASLNSHYELCQIRLWLKCREESFIVSSDSKNYKRALIEHNMWLDNRHAYIIPKGAL